MELKMRASLWFMLFLPSVVIADVPNTFQAGEAIKASEMNENFNSLDNAVEQIVNEVSTLEADVTAMTGLQQELDLLNNNVSALEYSINITGNGSPSSGEFVGFSEPAVFGGLGINVGRAMCPNRFPGSRICNVDDILTAGNTNYISGSPIFIVSGTKNNWTNPVNPCGNFSSRQSLNTSVGMIQAGKLFLEPYGSSIFSSYKDGYNSRNDYYWINNGLAYKYHDAWDWIQSNFVRLGDTGSVPEKGRQLTSPGSDSTYTGESFSICNISVPAACCNK